MLFALAAAGLSASSAPSESALRVQRLGTTAAGVLVSTRWFPIWIIWCEAANKKAAYKKAASLEHQLAADR